jgi:hypothetical protein
VHPGSGVEHLFTPITTAPTDFAWRELRRERSHEPDFPGIPSAALADLSFAQIDGIPGCGASTGSLQTPGWREPDSNHRSRREGNGRGRPPKSILAIILAQVPAGT